MARIFVLITYKDGCPDDSAAELLAAALRIFPAEQPIAVVAGSGPLLFSACEALRTCFAEIWRIDNEALAAPNAELVRSALLAVLPRQCILLVPHSHFGIDLSPGLSVKMDAAYVPDVVDLEGLEGSVLKVVRQEFGGQVSSHVRCDISSGAVLNLRPGAFKPAACAPTNGAVIDKSFEIGMLSARRRYLETIIAETGDVDITRQQVLVSVGRGIQDQENIAIAQELADVLGGAVSCSRPVVDARWLDKSRQVGSSGKTVKPRVYLACGISGSFQHLAGLKGSPFIIAINKNPKAPIFRVANVGVVADILEFLPALTAKIREHAHVMQ